MGPGALRTRAARPRRRATSLICCYKGDSGGLAITASRRSDLMMNRRHQPTTMKGDMGKVARVFTSSRRRGTIKSSHLGFRNHQGKGGSRSRERTRSWFDRDADDRRLTGQRLSKLKIVAPIACKNCKGTTKRVCLPSPPCVTPIRCHCVSDPQERLALPKVLRLRSKRFGFLCKALALLGGHDP